MIKKKRKKSYMEMDLTGPEGNVYVLIGTAMNLARQFGYDDEMIKEQMMSGDYENAVQTFDKHFGDYVTLYR
jgi:hypothetical protein|tara:strand:- start:122 stop:337 length:216 start_codon:yes stop_codon:yes gene_type:complete